MEVTRRRAGGGTGETHHEVTMRIVRHHLAKPLRRHDDKVLALVRCPASSMAFAGSRGCGFAASAKPEGPEILPPPGQHLGCYPRSLTAYALRSPCRRHMSHGSPQCDSMKEQLRRRPRCPPAREDTAPPSQGRVWGWGDIQTSLLPRIQQFRHRTHHSMHFTRARAAHNCATVRTTVSSPMRRGFVCQLDIPRN